MTTWRLLIAAPTRPAHAAEAAADPGRVKRGNRSARVLACERIDHWLGANCLRKGSQLAIGPVSSPCGDLSGVSNGSSVRRLARLTFSR